MNRPAANAIATDSATPMDGAGPALADALALASDTRHVVVARGALAGVARTFVEAFGPRSAAIVADPTTYEVAGRPAQDTLRAAGVAVEPSYVFAASEHGHPLHAEYRHAVRLAEWLSRHDAVPVAAGAGTVNDLVKLGAHLAGRPYMVVATAASVDGYAAFGAAITRDGFKQTIACPAPRAILADVDVLAGAPLAMTAAGFGDLLGKITAGADWLVADALGVEPLLPAAWDMVQPAARSAAADAERLRAREPEALERLFRCLTMSGLAMQLARSSRPASGAEHQLSHLWEMRGVRHQGAGVSHGFKVAVGTATIAALYDWLLDQDLAQLDAAALAARWPAWPHVELEVRRWHAEPRLREQALTETRAKYLDRTQLQRRLAQVGDRWPALRDRLRRQLISASEARRLLRAAGCPTHPEEIGLEPADLVASIPAARQIRRRYTVLDLALECGLLEPGAAEAVGPARVASGASGKDGRS